MISWNGYEFIVTMKGMSLKVIKTVKIVRVGGCFKGLVIAVPAKAFAS